MSPPFRLAIVATHPIQYYAPLFRELAGRSDLSLTVLYAARPTPAEQGIGFGVPFEWDTDLTSGYDHEWLTNAASNGRANGFRAYDTPEIGQHLLGGKYDGVLVLGWHAKTYWQAMTACWRHGIPVFVRGDSQLRDDVQGWKRGLKRAVYPWFMARFAACLSVGERSEEYFRYYGARRVVRSPHFVDNDAFAQRAAGARNAARARWGIGRDEFVVLFAGKLVPKKRPEDIIAAVARSQSQAVVLIVGDGMLRSSCETSAQAAGVRAIFAGFQNQQSMPAAYAAADILVLPSGRRETWGLVVNEGMACGLPAFTSDAAGCTPDLIVPGVTGERFAPGDVSRLSMLMAEASSDPARLMRMGAAARHRIARYSVAAAANGLMTAVEDVRR